MEDKVILDEQSFKALSANSRVSILKKLTERRMTLTELSKRLNLKGSTIKEHCTILVNAQLIKKIDEGRKWKYYELTGKGKQIVAPSFMSEARVLVTLCFSAIILSALLLMAFQISMSMESMNYAQQGDRTIIFETGNSLVNSVPSGSADVLSSASDSQEKTVAEEIDQNDQYTKKSLEETAPNPFLPFALIGMLVVGIIIGWIARKKL